MKKFNFLKTIQLILFVCFAVISLFLILVDSRLYQLVAHDPQVRILCILLWLVFVLSFLFIFVDFSIISSATPVIPLLRNTLISRFPGI